MPFAPASYSDLTKVFSWGKPLNLLTGNFLNTGTVIGDNSNGYVFEKAYTVIALTWSFGNYSKAGRLTFQNNTTGSAIDFIDVGPVGSTPSEGGATAPADFAAFVLPAGQKVGLFWNALEGGNAPQEVNISVTMQEVQS